jgi:hypothetical protein
MAAGMSAMVWASGSRAEFFALFAVSFRLAGGESSRCERDLAKKTAMNAKTREEREWDRAVEAFGT